MRFLTCFILQETICYTTHVLYLTLQKTTRYTTQRYDYDAPKKSKNDSLYD